MRGEIVSPGVPPSCSGAVLGDSCAARGLGALRASTGWNDDNKYFADRSSWRTALPVAARGSIREIREIVVPTVTSRNDRGACEPRWSRHACPQAVHDRCERLSPCRAVSVPRCPGVSQDELSRRPNVEAHGRQTTTPAAQRHRSATGPLRIPPSTTHRASTLKTARSAPAARRLARNAPSRGRGAAWQRRRRRRSRTAR